MNTDRSCLLKPCSCRFWGEILWCFLVVLCIDVIQVVCTNQPFWLCFHSSPASWVCLPFSPSLSSLDRFTPLLPFHTLFRHFERDKIRLENSCLFVKEGLDYESVCSECWETQSVFLPWSESLRKWVAQKNLSRLSSWWWKYQFSKNSSFSSNMLSHFNINIKRDKKYLYKFPYINLHSVSKGNFFYLEDSILIFFLTFIPTNWKTL